MRRRAAGGLGRRTVLAGTAGIGMGSLLGTGGIRTVLAASPDDGQRVYDFTLTSIDDKPMPLKAYAGHPLLIVNTASFCGYTYQYEALQRVWERFRRRGLVVIGLPSGDFANEEYGANDEIKTFCQTRFDIDFPMTAKVHVRGPGADPIFLWLRRELGDGPGPLWNFHKYLVDAEGRAVASFPSALDPDNPEILAAIEHLLRPQAG
ncbi:glutathione peroxidase [Arboricoccus pini]|uniref:Glutathione peroxidase n=1 Tax=Arboricoccus pini TaxID=1963835 RepID=A0A212QUW2_9PROT|nr:glutathione peroxidase [Arboricoccus pini]SNB63508.1 glutathione peroxidase [Arboricoccus pini]